MSVNAPATLVRSPWTQKFEGLISAVERDLLIASPFVKTESASRIISNFGIRGVADSVRLAVIPNIRPESAVAGSLDLEALTRLAKAVPQFELTHLPSLHAKVYVADERMAVVTSANLTEPGICGNLEYGVEFTDPVVVRRIRADFENYALLGARVPVADIEQLLDETAELKRLSRKAEKSIRGQARRAFARALEATRLQLLRQRAKGRTTQGILSDTIMFLLAKGPLTTTELHPLVQQLQPDLCDDSIDRVIDGVHFGKRWKHHVRSAQQYLKRTGRVWYDGNCWHLVGEVPSART
jgi:hypothetical protein